MDIDEIRNNLSDQLYQYEAEREFYLRQLRNYIYMNIKKMKLIV